MNFLRWKYNWFLCSDIVQENPQTDHYKNKHVFVVLALTFLKPLPRAWYDLTARLETNSFVGRTVIVLIDDKYP